ncbi:MAG: ABC transporter permease [Oscillospiraceae bacterium]|nr:ABC transporter permease [Oscillospiraceae bacterium]
MLIADWSEIIERILVHFQISVTGVALATVVGMIIGITLTRFPKIATPALSVIEVFQTIPSLAMLSILLIFLGLGNNTAIMAIFFYSLLPIVRNTHAGILSVDPALLDAGKGMGMNSFQVLFKVEIPNAIPVILSGLRISLITAYGIVTISVLVGGGGLGRFVIRGIQMQNMGVMLTGAIPIAAMALLTDLLLNYLEKRMTRHNRSSRTA